jgi:acetyltransferase-like isoleucine patch superfamily enzyme
MQSFLGRILLKLIPDALFQRKMDQASRSHWLSMTRAFKHCGNHSNVSGYALIKNPQYISIGDNFSALHNLRLEAWDAFAGEQFTPLIEIGHNVHFNSDCHIGAIDRVVIKDNVLIASRVYIADHSHGDTDAAAIQKPPGARPLVSKGPVIIEENVWIGEGVCVLPGVTIGRNSIVGANAVVTRDIPADSVAAGIPAKVIKKIY